MYRTGDPVQRARLVLCVARHRSIPFAIGGGVLLLLGVVGLVEEMLGARSSYGLIVLSCMLLIGLFTLYFSFRSDWVIVDDKQLRAERRVFGHAYRRDVYPIEHMASIAVDEETDSDGTGYYLVLVGVDGDRAKLSDLGEEPRSSFENLAKTIRRHIWEGSE